MATNGLQGHVLSRLHLTKGPSDSDRDSAKGDEATDAITSEAAQEAARSVQMTDLEHVADDVHPEEEDRQQVRKREGSHGKHVHMADMGDGGSLHSGSQLGGRRTADVDRKKKLWDDMVKHRVAADLEKQRSDNLADATASPSEGEDHMSRVNSQAALLGKELGRSEEVLQSLESNPAPSPAQQPPPLQQSRLLSRKGLLSAMSNSMKFLPALMKKNDGPDEVPISGGPTRHSGGGLAGRMETAGSVDSNAPLLPGGMPPGQTMSAFHKHTRTRKCCLLQTSHKYKLCATTACVAAHPASWSVCSWLLPPHKVLSRIWENGPC